MAYTATITMDDKESFTATSITYRAGMLEFTGASAMDTRAIAGLRVDSASAGGAVLGRVVSITVA